MKAPILNLVFLFIAQISLSNNPPAYISSFKDLAIQEMERTGIPASITLAQGIIESAWGKGVLARSSNNHFGIKCKKDWSGKAYLIEDDDYDSTGKLIKSCFRAYDDVADSYIDHSNFLKKSARYASLFDLDSRDYVSWAHGLQAAGYATDPAYAEKLISKIEMYDLYEYDLTTTYPAISQEEILEAPSYIIPQDVEILEIEVVPSLESSPANLSEEELDNSNEEGRLRLTIHQGLLEIR